MFTTIIAIFIISFFVLMIGVGIWGFIKLNKIGLLQGFMRGKWLASLLTSLLVIAFLTGSVGLLAKSSWAQPLLVYTIYIWLVYVWLYNLRIILNMVALLQNEKPTSISHFMGRSQFYDDLIHKTIELSKNPEGEEDDGQEAHAASDPPLEEMLNDETMFPLLFQIGIRRKIKRKLIGLLIHTVIFLTILTFIS
ncbi:hypothetical protein [Flavilitoribacter nigricans]|uniref:Uncharacterized protein n=1 Tax=Flavilitoribacter nigricans (strain ATCC 23147 / DSM 23189 / NBRC 102662 / NCIMB 1420 / SS-2) TaxID=1122177 RepID=A0A2D0N7D2_FLAN2|nr:hypothetical protein [Flavilitoribacter nigricans]PHN04308.1 hypothetical protein CRP01_22355 [Flavilitoribacter nigricans DSM 23189 = NBRC 102662]